MKLTASSPHKYLQRIVLLSGALQVLAAPHSARADVPPPPFLNPTQAQISPIRYPTLRIGDIAPLFALPDARGRLWSSTSRLGQSALLLVNITAPRVPTSLGDQRNAVPVPEAAQIAIKSQLLASQLKTAATRLEKSPVTIVVVASGAQFDALLSALGGPEASEKRTNLLLLREDETASTDTRLSELMGSSESGVSLAAIDRAGFLRQWEALDDLQTLDAHLWAWNDVTPRLEVGRPAPDFAISDMNGHARRLSDLRGQQSLLLTFFPKCFTGGCANHLSSLGAERLAFQSAKTRIWGVSFDEAGGERGQIAFARQLGLSFPLIPDTGRNLALLYEAAFSNQQPAPVRMTILIDRDGLVRHIERAVQVRTHGPDMLLKMRELGLIE